MLGYSARLFSPLNLHRWFFEETCSGVWVSEVVYFIGDLTAIAGLLVLTFLICFSIIENLSALQLNWMVGCFARSLVVMRDIDSLEGIWSTASFLLPPCRNVGEVYVQKELRFRCHLKLCRLHNWLAFSLKAWSDTFHMPTSNEATDNILSHVAWEQID